MLWYYLSNHIYTKCLLISPSNPFNVLQNDVNVDMDAHDDVMLYDKSDDANSKEYMVGAMHKHLEEIHYS